MSLFFWWTEKAVNRWFCQKHQSKQCMKASFNLKYFLDANVSVSHKLCKQENFRICWKVEVVFWFNCTHVMVVPVVQSTILNEMNSPMRQKNNGPGCEPLKAVIVSLRGYWGPPFDLIRNTKYIDTYFWKLNSITRWSYYQFPKDRWFIFCEIFPSFSFPQKWISMTWISSSSLADFY